MLEQVLMGFDETTLAYDLQRAHSADVWFLRARFFIWGTVATISSFLLGQLLTIFGVNIVLTSWEGFWNFIYTYV